MSHLVLHSATERQLANFSAAPSHAVILVGPDGSGKLSLAHHLIEEALELPVGGFADHPYTMAIGVEEDKKLIAIEAIRQIEQFLSLKVPGTQRYDRAIIIEDAHLLSLEAQNALLKTLEEPPSGTLLVMTASHLQALLPTIRSRAQTITVSRPQKPLLEAHFNDFDDKAFQQAYAISGGLPGLMDALLNQEDHPLTEATGYARRLLSQTSYERLLLVDELSKQRQLASDVAFILQQMAHVSLQTAEGPAAKQWQRVLTASYQAAEALENSAQPKLALTNLMLSL